MTRDWPHGTLSRPPLVGMQTLCIRTVTDAILSRYEFNYMQNMLDTRCYRPTTSSDWINQDESTPSGSVYFDPAPRSSHNTGGKAVGAISKRAKKRVLLLLCEHAIEMDKVSIGHNSVSRGSPPACPACDSPDAGAPDRTVQTNNTFEDCRRERLTPQGCSAAAQWVNSALSLPTQR
jgi:hypothetical protein